MPKVVDFSKLSHDIYEPWKAIDLFTIGDVSVRLARIEGEYRWHVHKHEDELFIVIEGTVVIDEGEHSTTLTPGMGYLVPAGSRHRSRSDGVATVLLVEPTRTITTGEQ